MECEPTAIAAGNRRSVSEPAGPQARGPRGKVRLPPAGPHPEIPGSRYPLAARHVRAQPGFESLRLPALLPYGQPGERGAVVVRGISGRASLAYLHRFARTQPVRRQWCAGNQPQPGVSHPRDASGWDRKELDDDPARHYGNRAAAAGRPVPHHSAGSSGGVESGHQRGFHHRKHGDRAAVAASDGTQRSRGLDRHRGADRGGGGDDEHRHALDRHQDDAPEVRPAMVGAQDACQRRWSSDACCACSARRHCGWRRAWKGPRSLCEICWSCAKATC